MAGRRPQTVRIRDLPSLCVPGDVHTFLRLRNIINAPPQAIVGPVCPQPESLLKQTTVSFVSSDDCCAQVLGLPEGSRIVTSKAQAEDGRPRSSMVQIDQNFLDMTTVYYAENPATGRPDVDMVVTHGLGGHAFNSYTTWVEVRDGQLRELNWLRDILPEYLKGYQAQSGQRGIYPRILTFGYNANIWTNAMAHAEFNHAVDNMTLCLNRERREDPTRPLFFIAHSLGGIVCKSVICRLCDGKRADDRPVGGCLFFAVPHKGAGVAGTFGPLLEEMGKFFNVSGKNVNALRQNSQILQDIAVPFHFIRDDFDIPVVSCFELDRDGPGRMKLIVPKESAILEYDGRPPAIGIYQNHREIVKFKSSSDQGFAAAIDSLAQQMVIALSHNSNGARNGAGQPDPAATLSLDPKQENLLTGLGRFDTVFLVDDSESMEGKNWTLAKAILMRAVAISVKYDKNGLDIHFLNDVNHSTPPGQPLKTAAVIAERLDAVTPYGSTPLNHQLQSHLWPYLDDVEKRAHRHSHSRSGSSDLKLLNLIIITDGEPDDPYKNIRRTIVKAAKRLDLANAYEDQVGLQFCVLGNDPEVWEFYKKLDDDLEQDEDLERDMVDAIQCRSLADLTDQFFLKLLTGGWNKGNLGDAAELAPQQSPGSNGQQMRPSPTW